MILAEPFKGHSLASTPVFKEHANIYEMNTILMPCFTWMTHAAVPTFHHRNKTKLVGDLQKCSEPSRWGGPVQSWRFEKPRGGLRKHLYCLHCGGPWQFHSNLKDLDQRSCFYQWCRVSWDAEARRRPLVWFYPTLSGRDILKQRTFGLGIFATNLVVSPFPQLSMTRLLPRPT